MKHLLIWLIRFYQRFLSPLLHFLGGPGSGCRFHPTCSQYAIESLKVHGIVRGTWLSIRRISRCHPWGGHGEDPVPEPKKKPTSRDT